jgi:hypothetical protein
MPGGHVPLGDTSVGGQSSVQVAARGSVLIQHVTPNDRAEPLDVEVRVLDL